MLHQCNPSVYIFQQAGQILAQTPPVDLHFLIRSDVPGLDQRRYNNPTVSEVSAIIMGDESEKQGPRDIIVKRQDGLLQRIFETQPSYDALHYVLLFARGEYGWTFTLKDQKGGDISLMDFCSHRLQV